MAETLNTPQPHYIPGYTGYCPQYKYRIGDTFGTASHKLLFDPTVSHAERLILSDRSKDDFKVFRPPTNDIDIVSARFRQTDAVYKHPMMSSYEGFVPRLNALFGQRYTVQATEALAEHERKNLKDTAALNQLIKRGLLQDGKWEPRSTEDRMLAESQFKLPLLEVRPERAGILRNLPVDEPPLQPPISTTSPYFMETSNPDKKLKQGFAGHVPFGYPAFGKAHEPMTNSALCDFTSNYRRRQSTEWAPVSVSRPDPPLLIQPTEIYHKHIGQLPDYQGHIPGSQFRFGKTFGNDSRDAKRWLRGDFST